MSSPESPAEHPTRPSWTLRLGAIAFLAGAAFLGYSGIESRTQDRVQLGGVARARAVPTVAVATPAVRQSLGTLELPGRLAAYSEAAIFSRVSGYVATRHADIGSRVKAGELLAEIDAPELDQQLLQAQSDLNNAKTNAALAEVTNKRYQALLPSSAVSHQTADERAADLQAKNALVASAQANVDRLNALSKYKRIVAPFEGIVTVRNTDVGNLINTGSASGSEMFVLADIKRLRVYVPVPQSYVPAVTNGTGAVLSVPERPGKTYAATVEASAGAVDVASGTTRMQLVVDNAAGELLPGAYANVVLTVGNRRDVLVIPSSALIFDKSGMRVATVDDENRIALKPITIGRDLGSTIEVAAGLAAEDRVIESPPDGLVDGDLVAVQEKPVSAATPAEVNPAAAGKGKS